MTLFDYLFKVRKNGDFPEELVRVYKDVLTELQRFQITGAKGLDYSVCYPRSSFDSQAFILLGALDDAYPGPNLTSADRWLTN